MLKEKLLPAKYKISATLWDGKLRLEGIIELREDILHFVLKDFSQSNLNLTIPLSNIERIEEYLVFDLAKNGLRIMDKSGRADVFVLDDPKFFKKLLLNQISKLNSEI